MNNHEHKPTVVFDFDGVIHSYTSGWQGVTNIPDPPVEGIKEAIEGIRKEYKVVIVSTRCESTEGISAILAWLIKWGIQVDSVTAQKPPAIVYIDDRAICFDGNTKGLLDTIKEFKPWYQMRKTCANCRFRIPPASHQCEQCYVQLEGDKEVPSEWQPR